CADRPASRRSSRSAIARSSLRAARSSRTTRRKRSPHARLRGASTMSSDRSRRARSRHEKRRSLMHNVRAIFRREFASYFATPLAFVFIVIFLLLAGVVRVCLGGWSGLGKADLTPFVSCRPWLSVFLIPALSMRLWAEEPRSGSIEQLMTLPVTAWQAVLGKYLAAWC